MESKTEITLQPKAAFAEENAAFLAQYDTEVKQIDFYTDQAMRIFEEFQIDGNFSRTGVRKNVSCWYNNKKRQMELFRKHPYWSEEAKAIVFLQTEVRNIDYREAVDKLKQMARWIDWEHSLSSTVGIMWAIQCGMEQCTEKQGIITDTFIEYFNSVLAPRIERVPKAILRSLRKGTKLTKFVRKCCEHLIDDDGKEFNATTLRTDSSNFDKHYAAFADCLSELTVQKITVVSLHFCDFMTMSNGNSWSSCHFINSHGIFHDNDTGDSYRGAYKAGCLSYALDAPSFLLYTLPSSYEGTEYYRQQKINRMCCQYEAGILITGKCYPNNKDEMITRYRQMMQLVISQVEEVPNLWSFSRRTSKIQAFAETADNSAHYEDYIMDGQKPTISFCKGMAIDPDQEIIIGHHAYCLQCGDELDGDEHNWLQCDKVSCRRKRVCEHCGRAIGQDEAIHTYNDNIYCDDCVFWCDHHQQYEPIYRCANTLETHDGEITVCDSALCDYAKCPKCGLYAREMDMEYVEGVQYCSHCVQEFKRCSKCGQYCTDLGDDGLCSRCKYFAEHGVSIIKQEAYKVGDYVLMADDVSVCHWSANGSMEHHYPRRIVKILRQRNMDEPHHIYEVTKLDHNSWNWCQKCIAGVVVGATDADIGKTIEEFMEGIA